MKLSKLIHEEALEEFSISNKNAYKEAINRLPDLLKFMRICENKMISTILNDVKNGKYTFFDLATAASTRGAALGAMSSEKAFLEAYIKEKKKTIQRKEK